VKNITVSVPDDVYRSARVAAAQRDTSVSALVVAYLEQLSGRIDEFARLEALQREVQAGIGQFRASGRLSRDEVHDRAVRTARKSCPKTSATARTTAASGSPIRSAEKTEQPVSLSFAPWITLSSSTTTSSRGALSLKVAGGKIRR
jgi:hypothetical protein